MYSILMSTDGIDKKALGRNIRALRQARGLTQHQLANSCGFPDVYVYRYEKGRAEPSLSRAVRMANALETSINNLLDAQMPLPSRGDLLVGVG